MLSIISATLLMQQPSLGPRFPETITIKSAPKISRLDFDLIMPEKNEYEGCKLSITSYKDIDHNDIDKIKKYGCYNYYNFFFNRISDGLATSINLRISVDPHDIGLVSMLGSTSTTNNPLEKKTSFTGKSIGKYVWSYPTSLLVEDYWILMKIHLMPQNKLNSDKSITFGNLTDDEKVWAEEMGRKILDRATVLGLTSRTAESAPLWAKEQVAKRRAEQKRQ